MLHRFILGFLLFGLVTPAYASKTPQFFEAAPKKKTNFRRVVSLAPVVTETLFALGVGDRVVGVTRFCDRPSSAQSLPKVGGFVDGNLEAMVALRPDLIVAMPQQAQQSHLKALRKMGFPVYLVFGDTVSEISQMVLALGRLFHRDKKAKSLLRDFKQKYDSFHQVLRRPNNRVVAVAGLKPLIVAGPQTFVQESLTHLGLQALPEAQGPLWPVWAMEHLVAQKPDLVLVLYPSAQARNFSEKLKSLCSGSCRTVVPETPIFQRPGLYLHEDLQRLQNYFQRMDSNDGPN